MRCKLLFMGCCLASLSATAQQELFLYQQADLWHANTLNPAYFPENKRFVIGAPGLSIDAAHSGDVSYNDLFRREDDRTIIDLGNIVGRLEAQNQAAFDQRTETVSLGYRLPGGILLHAGHAIRLNSAFQYPKSLADMLWYGNAPYIGQTVDIALSADVINWSELSVGAAKKFGQFTLGGRAKYLSGIGTFRSDETRNKATVYTSDDIYQLTLNTDYGFQSAYIVSAIDTAGYGFDIQQGELKRSRIFSKNSGFAFDLGFQWQVSERLSVSASALDLGGSIKWKDNANYLYSNGSYEYSGVTIAGVDIINGTDSIDFELQLDTINDIFRFNKTPQEFSSSLPTRYYAGARFKISDKWSLGLSVFHQNGAQRDATAAGLGLQWTPVKWLSVGALYSYTDRPANNVGFNVQVRPGPVQVYFTSDNLLNAFTPYSVSTVNFRVGGALVF